MVNIYITTGKSGGGGAQEETSGFVGGSLSRNAAAAGISLEATKWATWIIAFGCFPPWISVVDELCSSSFIDES